MTAIRTHISAISSVVSNVTSSTEHLFNKPTISSSLRERSGPILQSLGHHRARLMEAADQGDDAIDISELREVTKRFPPIAFEIARETKELVHRLDLTDDDDSEEDDFR